MTNRSYTKGLSNQLNEESLMALCGEIPDKEGNNSVCIKCNFKFKCYTNRFGKEEMATFKLSWLNDKAEEKEKRNDRKRK